MSRQIILSGIVLAFALIVTVYAISNLSSSSDTSPHLIKELDDAAIRYLEACHNAISIDDILQCKTSLSETKVKCNDELKESKFCSDPRLNEFFDNASTKLERASHEINKSMLNLIGTCDDKFSPTEECKASMRIIQENCKEYDLDACYDGRILQIINGQLHDDLGSSHILEPMESKLSVILSDLSQKPSPYTAQEAQIISDNAKKSRICGDTVKKMIRINEEIELGKINPNNPENQIMMGTLQGDVNECDVNMLQIYQQCKIDGLCSVPELSVFYEIRSNLN